MDHPITSVIAGRYALADKLGEGGMGAVYRARDRLTGQSVAVKRLAIAAGMADTQARVEFAGTTVGDLRPLASGDRTRNARRPTESGPGPTAPPARPGPSTASAASPSPTSSASWPRCAIPTSSRCSTTASIATSRIWCSR
jgi:hypothetical protein